MFRKSRPKFIRCKRHLRMKSRCFFVCLIDQYITIYQWSVIQGFRILFHWYIVGRVVILFVILPSPLTPRNGYGRQPVWFCSRKKIAVVYEGSSTSPGFWNPSPYDHMIFKVQYFYLPRKPVFFPVWCHQDGWIMATSDGIPWSSNLMLKTRVFPAVFFNFLPSRWQSPDIDLDAKSSTNYGDITRTIFGISPIIFSSFSMVKSQFVHR